MLHGASQLARHQNHHTLKHIHNTLTLTYSDATSTRCYFESFQVNLVAKVSI